MSNRTSNVSVALTNVAVPFYILDEGLAFDVMFVSFCVIFVIACFGVVTCVISAAIFVQLGFKDTVNISLFALALSDLCTLLPLAWMGVLAAPQFLPFDLDFIGMDVLTLTGSWSRTCFTRITSWITAYIMLERCLCIVSPLKVKILLTPSRVKRVLVVIFVLNFAGIAPTYCTYGLGKRFSLAFNKTLLAFMVTDNAAEVTHMSNLLNNPVSALCSFLVTFLSTVIIAKKLTTRQKWREESSGITSATQVIAVSSKDRKAVKMVTLISTVFFISVTPSACLSMVNILDVQFTLHGGHRCILYVTYTFSYLLESLSASSNVVIYYTMNSRYRNVFQSIFCVCINHQSK